MKSWTWLLLLLVMAIGTGGVWLLKAPLHPGNPTRTASLQAGGGSLASNPVGLDLATGKNKPDQLKVYRWKDPDDTWSLANAPPPAGTEHEVIDYSPQ